MVLSLFPTTVAYAAETEDEADAENAGVEIVDVSEGIPADLDDTAKEMLDDLAGEPDQASGADVTADEPAAADEVLDVAEDAEAYAETVDFEYTIFHLDCGRKYFTVAQVKTLIDALAENGYTHMELAIGNDGLHFLLDDMSVGSYTSDAVKAGIQAGNKAYYNAGTYNEWTRSEMDEIIAYAKSKGVGIIPLLNTPGHMDAILDCMESVGISDPAYNNSARTVDVTNTAAVNFTLELVNKSSRVNITLYGASPETYGALCGDPSAYERAVRAILGLRAAGVLVKLNFSVTPYNRRDLPAAYQFAREHGLHIQAASYMFPPVRACEHGCFQADRLTPEESARAQLDYDCLRFPPEELRPRLERLLAGGTVPDPDRECQELPTERIRCRAGSSTFWVTWDGQLRPCGMMTTPTEDLGTQSFRGAWANIRAARERIMVPPACSGCPVRSACDQCSAICQAETGAFTGVPEYMCQRTQAYLELGRKWLEEQGAPEA